MSTTTTTMINNFNNMMVRVMFKIDGKLDRSSTASNALKLTTSRKLAITGDAIGEMYFDGSTDSLMNIALAQSPVSAGAYSMVTVNSKGLVIYGRALIASDIPILNQNTVGNALTATTFKNPVKINGVNFDGSIDVTIRDSTKIAITSMGIPFGVATLDSSGLVPAEQLPSYVDDVLEFNNLANFPAIGERGKIYLTLDTNLPYRWTGSVYLKIVSGAVDTVAGRAGVVVLTKSDVGLANVDNTADVNKSVAIATKLNTPRSIGWTGDVAGSVTFDGSANVISTLTLANTGVTAGSYAKPTVDAKGRVTGGSSLLPSDIPSLDISKLTTGTLPILMGGTGANSQSQALLNLGIGNMANRNVFITTGVPSNSLGNDGDFWCTFV
jgi:phage-related tail fiber protein